MKCWATTLILIWFSCSPVLAQMNATSPRIPVAIELVFAIDNSSSVDSREYELQRQGIAKAFADPDVIEAITSLNGGVAVAMFQWGEKARSRMVLPFTHINNQRNAKAFAFRVSVLPRARPSAYTALGHAIIASAKLLEENGFDGARRIIDISGDGRNNNGISPEAARAGVVALGITINGLPVMADDNTLHHYYQSRVVGGPFSFIEPAIDYDAFAIAIKRKLLREFQLFIADAGSQRALD